MKTLLIMRHAKSSWKDADEADHDRPLNKRGQRDAPRMGAVLRQHDLTPELMLCSTALRARATAAAVAEACGFDGEIRLTPSFYAAGPDAYVNVLHTLDDDYERVMVVGHNPGLEELVELLTGEAETMPTCAVAHVRLPLDRWRALRVGIEGELVAVWRPRESG